MAAPERAAECSSTMSRGMVIRFRACIGRPCQCPGPLLTLSIPSSHPRHLFARSTRPGNEFVYFRSFVLTLFILKAPNYILIDFFLIWSNRLLHYNYVSRHVKKHNMTSLHRMRNVRFMSQIVLPAQLQVHPRLVHTCLRAPALPWRRCFSRGEGDSVQGGRGTRPTREYFYYVDLHG